MNDLPAVAARFLRYVTVDTQSDPSSDTVPSTENQKDLSRMLAEELRALGLDDAAMDEHGYVYATLPSPLPDDEAARLPTLALLAHVDTSPDAPGAGVRPIVHRDYDGGTITLPGDPSVKLDPEKRPALTRHVGHDLITSDGTTLLGSDDKAGVAVVMQLVEDLIDDDAPRPTVRVCFTVDEEVGRGVDALDLERLGADVAYTIDGSATGTLYAETFNAAKATIEVEGVMVHPGYAKGVMVNAARIVSELITALPANEAPETTAGREGYLHPHRFGGNAGRAEATLILRDFSEEGLGRRKRLVEAMVAQVQLKHPRAAIRLTIEDQYKNMKTYIEEADPRAVSFALDAGREMGLVLKQEIVRGGTDGARLSEMGVPTPNVFNGGHDYHSRFEWNTVQNLELSLSYVRHLITYWGRHGTDEE